MVRNNVGGLNIEAGSNGAVTKLSANITNNLFEATKHRPSLYIESKKRSSYQEALIAFNDFSWAQIPYRDVITLAQVVFSYKVFFLHSTILLQLSLTLILAYFRAINLRWIGLDWIA